ncbi:MAG: S8 family serine peptidase [Planctomycetes bacterium]|nr:S8 family serine peptidase [Planctomycetota bacterium]
MHRSPILSTILAVGLGSAAFAQRSVDADKLHLRFATFDPARTTLELPAHLTADKSNRLFVVQFDRAPDGDRRAALARLDAQIVSTLPANAFVVRMRPDRERLVRSIAGVRATLAYHPAFRLEPELITELATGDELPVRKYNIVVANKHLNKPGLIARIDAIGGRIDHEQPGSLLLEVSLDRAQLLQTSQMPEVLWIDRWTAPELDMDNARIQGGANYVETAGGYTGKGVNGHVYEGLEAGHQDFTNRPINVLSAGGADTHGHCTAGIVFGNGTSIAGARGMAPDAQPFFTQYGTVTSGYSRWQVVERLVKTHEVMFTTASWGGGRTRAYTSTSAATDDIIFDHDIVWTNSQSNAGNQDSRPEAWAKNIISIGGVAHRNNANPLDDSWQAGNGSTGPAADGRIKPDLCAYYDGILCSDRTGSAGYSSQNYYTSFGGTSGATPIVAGHNAIAIQMFTDGLFSPQRVKNGTRFQNKPHFTTLKALQIANAAQYSFTKTSTDNRREHCGWGFPDLKAMYDDRALHYVVDETDVLTQGTGMAYVINVPANRSQLKVSLSYADPAANPSATLTRINDLTLRLTAPNGTTHYWGNQGLTDGNYSVAGGDRDQRDTVENVFVQNPTPGPWTVSVMAYLVAQDSHVETTAVDADFGLVAVGGTFVSKRPITISVADAQPFGAGCPSGTNCQLCYSENWTQTSTNQTTNATAVAFFESRSATDPVCGVDLYCGARSGSLDLDVEIWDADNTTLEPKTRIQTARVKVSSVGAYSWRFAQPVTLPFYWIYVKDADKLILPVSTTGSQILHRELVNNKWSDWLFNTRWQYRVYCNKGSVVPTSSTAERPIIGARIHFDLDMTKAVNPAVFLLGASDKNWASLQLPWTYAPGCSLLVSGEIMLGLVSDASGKATVPLDIPNDKQLLGATAFQQFMVFDTRTPLGFISSNGIRLLVGEF